MEHVNVVVAKDFKADKVNKVTSIKTSQIAQDTYYFKAGQVLDYHRHPEGDQVFFVQEGQGSFYLDDNGEEFVKIGPGSVMLAPRGVWHKLVAETDMIASQATVQPAGMEARAK
jgi:quercetin dioxygenase-like cupin family protein